MEAAKEAHIVVGLGYGDEGKGLVIDYLSKQFNNALVIRFNGGQQAGHTVVTNKHRHMFSNFGAGTFRNIPTYWSSYCTFSPNYFLDEYDLVPIKPVLYLDYQSTVTTHYDVLYNRAIEVTRGNARHGSCGLGFGATLERNNILPFQVDDLFANNVRQKLLEIRSYYRRKIDLETCYRFDDFEHDEEDEEFLKCVERLKRLIESKNIHLVREADIFQSKEFQQYLFEGGQGILLDVEYGTAPHVTKSNTTTKNAVEILKRYGLERHSVTVYYVTRAYQTRHGEGPFKQCSLPLQLKNNELESNRYNDFQGAFKVSYLDIDRLNYSLACDANYSAPFEKKLVITCVDQINPNHLPVYYRNEVLFVTVQQIPQLLQCYFSEVKFSYSDCSDYLDFV